MEKNCAKEDERQKKLIMLLKNIKQNKMKKHAVLCEMSVFANDDDEIM